MARKWNGRTGPRGAYERPYQATEKSPLAKERIRRGLTQAQAAELIGCHRTYLAGLETGKRHWPRAVWRNKRLLLKLEEFLNGDRPLPFDKPI